MFTRSIASALAGLAVVAIMQTHAAADPAADNDYSRFAVSIEMPRKELLPMWERFDVAFSERADDVFADQLRSFKMIRWNIEFADWNFDHYRQRTSSAGQHAFTKSITDSAREAATDLPFFAWLEEHQSFVGTFVRNSVGNVEEESLSPLSPSFGGVERSWWRRLADQGELRYGLRPFKTNPYAYVSYGIKDGDTLLLLTHVRYHYDHFADHQFEFAVSVPLAYGLAVDVGTSYQFGQHGEEKKLVLKLFKELKKGGIVHVGFEVKERPMLIAGTTFTW
jgi:hypothetical protein